MITNINIMMIVGNIKNKFYHAGDTIVLYIAIAIDTYNLFFIMDIFSCIHPEAEGNY